MAEQVTNYQCPACTGPLHFDGASGKLLCDYCGSSYTVEDMEALYAEKDEKAAQDTGTWEHVPDGWDTDGMKSYSCPSCGAELLCDASTAASSCPYCGNPSIIPGQLSGALRPDAIIPFRLDKKAAVDALRAHYKKKPLLPRAFSAQNQIEKIQGVYVPFWLFSGEADADISYRCTRSITHREGEYDVTDTQHFLVRRAGTVSFEKVPVDASSKMPDANMDSIEPFDYRELKPFSNAYLPGYLADRYDVDVEASVPRADARCRASCESAMTQTVTGYTTCVPERKQISLHRGKADYVLLPVWVLHTKWKGKDYLFSMNGQTGKLTGDLPVSMGRFWAYFAGIAGGLAAMLSVLLYAL